MTNNRVERRPAQSRATSGSCPWCGGSLVFDPHYPVVRLAPGDVRWLKEENIPEPLRTVPAWVCGTRMCRYRESA